MVADLVDAHWEHDATRFECSGKWSADARCNAVLTYAASDKHMLVLVTRLCGAVRAELTKLMLQSEEQQLCPTKPLRLHCHPMMM